MPERRNPEPKRGAVRKGETLSRRYPKNGYVLSQAAFASRLAPTGFSSEPPITLQTRHKKGDPKAALYTLLPELPPQPTRHTVNVRLFPRPLRTDRPAPAVIPAIIGTLAIEGIGLIIQHIDPKLRIPMTVAPRRRREAG